MNLTLTRYPPIVVDASTFRRKVDRESVRRTNPYQTLKEDIDMAILVRLKTTEAWGSDGCWRRIGIAARLSLQFKLKRTGRFSCSCMAAGWASWSSAT